MLMYVPAYCCVCLTGNKGVLLTYLDRSHDDDAEMLMVFECPVRWASVAAIATATYLPWNQAHISSQPATFWIMSVNFPTSADVEFLRIAVATTSGIRKWVRLFDVALCPLSIFIRLIAAAGNIVAQGCIDDCYRMRVTLQSRDSRIEVTSASLWSDDTRLLHNRSKTLDILRRWYIPSLCEIRTLACICDIWNVGCGVLLNWFSMNRLRRLPMVL